MHDQTKNVLCKIDVTLVGHMRCRLKLLDYASKVSPTAIAKGKSQRRRDYQVLNAILVTAALAMRFFVDVHAVCLMRQCCA